MSATRARMSAARLRIDVVKLRPADGSAFPLSKRWRQPPLIQGMSSWTRLTGHSHGRA